MPSIEFSGRLCYECYATVYEGGELKGAVCKNYGSRSCLKSAREFYKLTREETMDPVTELRLLNDQKKELEDKIKDASQRARNMLVAVTLRKGTWDDLLLDYEHIAHQTQTAPLHQTRLSRLHELATAEVETHD